MTHTLEINNTIYTALLDSFGEKSLKEKVNDIFVSGIENLLEKYTRKILKFEEKYAISFQEFERSWEEGKLHNKHSHEIESDYIDWEMMEAEKKELLTALSKLQTQKSNT